MNSLSAAGAVWGRGRIVNRVRIPNGTATVCVEIPLQRRKPVIGALALRRPQGHCGCASQETCSGEEKPYPACSWGDGFFWRAEKRLQQRYAVAAVPFLFSLFRRHYAEIRSGTAFPAGAAAHCAAAVHAQRRASHFGEGPPAGPGGTDPKRNSPGPITPPTHADGRTAVTRERKAARLRGPQGPQMILYSASA